MKNTQPSKIVPPSVKVMALPIIYIVILLAVSVFAVRTGVERINTQRRELKAAQKAENVLIEKEGELRGSIGINPPYVTPSTMALPDTNPALMIISNLKALAASRSVAFTDLHISGGSSGKSDVGRLGMTYTVGGDFIESINFMKDAKEYLPLMQTESMSLTVKVDSVEMNIVAQSFFSPYPEKLPPITDPINKITEEEYQILSEIAQKQTPAFFELSPTGPGIRSNPFSIGN